MSGLSFSSAVLAAACLDNTSPLANCDRLVIDSPNSNITVPSSVTIQGLNGDGIQNSATNVNLNNSGTIKTYGPDARYGIYNTGTISIFSNSGSVGGFYSGLINGIDANITSLLNTADGMIGGGGTGISNAGTIGTIVNKGLISSVFSTGFSNSGTIDVFSNIGEIRAPWGSMIRNFGTITTLNNLNGIATLTYSDTLPTNYNVIIKSPDHYGKLSITPHESATTFGIYAGGVSDIPASTLAKGTYPSVLTGFSPANLLNIKGKYNGFTWTLHNSFDTTWNLVVTGASTAHTQASIRESASALQKTYSLHSAVLANSLAHDCMVFDQKNICVSTGGRLTTDDSNGSNGKSALLVIAYRPKPSYRIGLALDQNVSGNQVGQSLSLSSKTPLIGFFSTWNEDQKGVGKEVKIATAYGQKHATIHRQIVGDSEAGSGTSRLDSQGIQITFKYGLGISEKIFLRPYAGIRHSKNSMGGYAESSSSTVTAPLTFAPLKANSTLLLSGLEGSYRFAPETTALMSLGTERHRRINQDNYHASGIDGLTPIVLNENPVKSRAAASLGIYHDLSKNQRLGLLVMYRQEPVRSISSTTAMLTYTVGL